MQVPQPKTDAPAPPAADAPAALSPGPGAGAGLALEDFIGDRPILFPPAPPRPSLYEATVSEAGTGEGAGVLCSAGGRESWAARAPSCLIEPRPGDRVLVCQGETAGYVLAVLERSGPAVVALPEDARIEGGRIAVAAASLEVTSPETAVRAGRLTLKGALAKADFSFLSVRARSLVRLAGSFLGRSRAHREEAEEAMKLTAPDVAIEAREAIRARAGTVDLKADGAAKLDGATVQLG